MLLRDNEQHSKENIEEEEEVKEKKMLVTKKWGLEMSRPRANLNSEMMKEEEHKNWRRKGMLKNVTTLLGFLLLSWELSEKYFQPGFFAQCP